MFGLDYEHTYTDFITSRSNLAFKEIDKLEKEMRKHGFIFRNTDFPLYPKMLIINAKLRRYASQDAEAMIAILEKVIKIYKNDKLTQQYFMLNEIQANIVEIEPGYDPHIRISRFDTFLTGDETPFKILENNTDCPAGTIFTGRVMNIIQSLESLKHFFDKIPPLNLDPISKDFTFFSELFKTYKEFCPNSDKLPTIGILQIREKGSPETHEMVKILSHKGITAIIVDPRDLKYRNKGLMFNDLKIDLVWNKINTAHFDPLLKNMNALLPFIQACKDKAICHVNSFQARYITESKLCSAYLFDSNFHHHFSKDEIALIKKVIPWAVKLEDNRVSFRGKELDTREIAYKYKNELVLKIAYDIRGEGVVIGKSVSTDNWRDLIDKAWNRPYIIQEYINPPQIETPLSNQTIMLKKFSMDIFMFGGKLQGFGSKVSDSDKLNLFQGGSKLAVFSL